MQVFLAAHPAECAAGHRLSLSDQVVPQVQVGHEVAGLIGETGMFLSSRLLPAGGAFPRVRDRERGGQHQHLAQAALGVRLQDHPAQPRVDGKLGEAPADVGYRSRSVERPEFLQQCHSVVDAAPLRRVEERKARDVAELQGGHLQDHSGEVGAQDLRVGESRPGREVLFGVEPNAHTGCGAAGPASPLRGRGLRDRLDR